MFRKGFRRSERFWSAARKHMGKFEPAAWSWALMTSDFGAPKRVLSQGTIKFKLHIGQIEYLEVAEPCSEN